MILVNADYTVKDGSEIFMNILKFIFILYSYNIMAVTYQFSPLSHVSDI